MPANNKKSIDKDYANYMADYNRKTLGLNVIPADTQSRENYSKWQEWQHNPIPESQHEDWKETGAFCKGMARMHGRVWHKSDLVMDTYWFSFDCDNHTGIDLLCRVFSEVMNKEYNSIADLSQDFLIDFHTDAPNKVHVSGYTKKPLLSKSSDRSKFNLQINSNQIPAIEVKSQGEDGIIFCPPSYHRDGYVYETPNKIQPKILTIDQAAKLMQMIDTELAKFGINYFQNTTFRSGSKKSMPILEEIQKPEFKVLAGHNRHECVLRIFESNLFTKMGVWSEEQIKADGMKWNQEHCVPPLTNEQIEGQWHDAKAFYEKHKNDTSSSPPFGITTFEQKRREEQEKELSQIQITKEHYEFLFSILKPEAKYDVKATKQLFYGFASAYTKTPFIMGVNSPSGSGKNHDIDIVADLFPSEDIIRLAGLSDKALFHLKGTQVIKNHETGILEPIEPHIKNIDKQIRELKEEIEDLEFTTDKNSRETNRQLIKGKKNKVDELEDNKKEIYKQSQKLIDFTYKVLIVEDTPRMSLLETITPLLGQNSDEKEYVFTDKRSSGSASLEAKANILRGCPAFISAQAVDYSRFERFGEINRRQMLVNPDMSQNKIAEAIRLQAMKWGAPKGEYEHNVISQKDKEKARQIVLILRAKLKQISKSLGHKEAGVFIPYYKTIVESLPKSNLWDITIADRLFRYLTMSTRINCDCRPKIVYSNGRIELIATFEDLSEALYLMQGSGSRGIRPYILEWFNKVLLPLYKSKNNIKATGLNSQGKEVTETHVGVTTDELITKTLEMEGKSTNSKQLLEGYLYPLENQGLIDSIQSVINKNRKIFFPTESASSSKTFFHSFSNQTNELIDNIHLNVTNCKVYPSKDILELQILTSLKHSSESIDFAQENNSAPKLFDQTSKIEKNARMLVEELFSFPEKYFTKGWLGESEDSKSSEDRMIDSRGISSNGSSNIVASAAISTDGITESNNAVVYEVNSKQEVTTKPDSCVINNVEYSDTNSIYNKILQNSAAFDLEWRNNSNRNSNEIYCACFYDCKDREILLHENHYKGYSEPRKAFMKDILNAILQYSVIVGHAILNEKHLGKDGKTIGIDSDLKVLQQNCVDLGLVREFEVIKSHVQFIDTFNIFSNNAIKASLSATDIDYRTNSLEDIAQAYINEDKLEHLNGLQVENLSESKQLEYCITDCHLVMKILRKNDWEILKILLNLSKEIGMPFLETCNARFPTKWWAHKLKSVGYAVPEKIRITKIQYEGALVLEPVIGIHRDVIPLDISAMYPTMAYMYNLSSETINCSCCVDSESARISEQVMNSINEGLSKLDPAQPPREWHYWICQQRRGKFAEIQHDLIQRKEQYKSLKLKTAEKATKLFANSGYGSFGHFGFTYYDPRLAELVTGYGRVTLKGLVSLISDPTKYNLPILYGDTDSMFVAYGARLENVQKIENFLSEAQEIFKIKLSKEKALKILVLTRNKKQYFGINSDGVPISKTMIGMKSDKTLYCQEITALLTSPEFLEPFIDKSNLTEAREKVLLFVKASFAKLEAKILQNDSEFIKHKLAYSLKASRSLDTYNNQGIHKEIYREIIEEAASQNNNNIDNSFFAGERVYYYYKIYPMYVNGHEKKYTIYPDKYALDLIKYKEELLTSIEPILEALGFDMKALRKEF